MTVDTRRPSLFTAPAPIRRLFNLFPLHIYDSEPLPQRAPQWTSETPRLHVFSSAEDAQNGEPSYNPSCLKWQAFFRIADVKVDLAPSNNHASPSGSLPFLLCPPPSTSSKPSPPAPTTPITKQRPLTGVALYDYLKSHSLRNIQSPSSPRAEAYRSLLSQNIRPAWLYIIYLSPQNTRLLTTLYLPDSPLLRQPALSTLRQAATAEILRTTREPHLSVPNLLASAEEAFAALSALLGDDGSDANEAGERWFFGEKEAGLFDAEVFAYTWLILNLQGGEDDRLREVLVGGEGPFGNLVRHAERLYGRYWGRTGKETTG